MASLYDLELHESNNFIHALMANGVPPSLKLMEDQVSSFKAMGEAGAALLEQLNDPNSEMGKSYTRLKKLQEDIIQTMKDGGLSAEDASKANSILIKNPVSLDDLSEEERKCVSTYWIKKKTIISKLSVLGYTPEEMFA